MLSYLNFECTRFLVESGANLEAKNDAYDAFKTCCFKSARSDHPYTSVVGLPCALRVAMITLKLLVFSSRAVRTWRRKTKGIIL
jgi:hypothetical protein